MHKKPILLKNIERGTRGGKLSIGILGTHSSVGVTHLSLLMATYLSEWLGQKTAMIQCGSKSEIKYLKQYFFKKSEEAEEVNDFSVNLVTFYKSLNGMDIPEIMGDQFNNVILDFGTDFARNKAEFLRCDIKIVVSSLAVWKKHELLKFISNTNYIKNSEQWIYAIPFTQKKSILSGIKELHKKIYGIPYEPDPFFLSTDSIHLFQKII